MGYLFLIAVSIHSPWLLHSAVAEVSEKSAHSVRVACVGDSITFGHGLKNREQECYPIKLAAKLGKGFDVRNFGVSGATLLTEGTRPYVDQPAYRESLAFKPQMLVIMLGTNDTNQKTWPEYGPEFVANYLELIKAFRDAEPSLRIWVCLPPPLFRDRGKAWDTDAILRDEVVPKIREVSQKANAQLIDLNAELAKSDKLFPDGVHPNAEGAELMASAIYKMLAKDISSCPIEKQ